MFPEDNAGLTLTQGLEEVNAKVRLVHAAWAHFSKWQEVGATCLLSATQLCIARSLLLEALEDWALAAGQLLRLSRQDSELDDLSKSLERSLRQASNYLSTVAAMNDPDMPLHVRFS